MQMIGAYLIFLLAVAALGLGAILCGVIAMALYGGASWLLAARLISHPAAARLRTGRS